MYLSLQPSCIKWKRCTNLPISMNSGHAVLIKGKVYYGGGLMEPDTKQDCGYLADNIVYCYNPARDSWLSLPPLKIKCFALGRVDNQLVASGGVGKSFQDRQIRAEVYTFDEKAQKWINTLPSMPTARCFHGVMSLESALVVAGGQVSCLTEKSSYTDSVEILKLEEQSWYRTSPLPISLFNMSAAVFNDTCYVVGGFRCKPLCSVHYATVENLLSCASCITAPSNKASYDKDRKCPESPWKSLTDTPTHQPSVSAVAGQLFSIGGCTREPEKEAQSAVYAYTPSTNSWNRVGDLPTAKRLCTSISLSSLEVMVIGGRARHSDLDSVYIGSLHH